MVKHQGYSEYKDSGVEWLGNTPVHWDAKPLKFLCTYNDEVLADSVSDDYEIEYVDIGSVSATEGVTKTESMFFGKAPSRARRIVRDGDVIISTVRTYLEAIASIDNQPENLVVSTGFAVIRPNSILHKGYAAFCLRASGFIKEVVAQSVGVSYPAINASDLVNIKVPEPTLEEQQKIASFLDHETAKIDTLIEKQQQLIKLLKEKRQAVMSHAVTKGLDPSAPMRDSGVEWLGDVPAHWDVSALKYHIDTVNGFGFSSTDVCEEGVPFIRAGNIKKKSITKTDLYLPQRVVDKYKRVVLSEGDIVISMVGSDPRILDSAVGQVGVVPKSMAGAVPNQNVVILREKSDSILKDFLFYILCSGPYRNHLNVFSHKLANQSIISSSLIVGAKFMLPSTLEQKKIIDFLDKRLDKVDDLVLRNYDSLELLKERRTALISAAVTGKIDVRNWQASEPLNINNKETAA